MEATTSQIQKMDRRTFLKATGITTSGLVLGLQWACSSDKPNVPFSPNVYLTINSDGSVVIVAHRQEMGTGIRTGLPLVLADELEADWSRVSLQQAVGDEKKYGNQNTDGSFSIRMFFEPMRKAGASARMMLEQAAAQKWGVDAGDCKAQNHEVVSKSGKKIGFGELTEIASKLGVPAEDKIVLKNKADWKYIGKKTNLYDTPDIVKGNAVYGIDVVKPGMKYAVILRCPVAGGKPASYSDAEALKVAGVVKIFEMKASGFPAGFDAPQGGIVVVADTTWAAITARKALEVEWDYGVNLDYDSDEYILDLVTKTKKKGDARRTNGSVDDAFKKADHILESTFITQHLSHAPMEPPNATALFVDGKIEMWAPVQSPQWIRDSVAANLELDAANVTINVTLLGGAFGRKSKPDFAVEAALIAKEMPGTPVKVTWTREDDLTHDFYHACGVQQIRVAFDKENTVTAWNHRSAFPPIGGTTNTKEIFPSTGELGLGAVDFPYNIPNVSIEAIEAPAKTRIGWLRSVSNIQHAFAVGSMVDEIATQRGVDPVKNLLELLGPDRSIPLDEYIPGFENYGEPIDTFPWNTARLRGVIELVAEKSGWGKPLPQGQGMGICAHRSFLTYVACAVHVSVDDAGKVSVEEAHYAVDCGQVVNRNSVINQFEGGFIFSLSGALKGSISFKDGASMQTNFDKYGVARMADAPKILQVHLVESDEKPTGVGEPPVPPVAPALANAIFAATGKRYREMPIKI
ncbi:MAG TPA: molybdopterin-dependent oxidoreductase [Cyclobacteriaceae bacterium]|jgi:isoquinoline 1-oxidoreductase beta subunit|nr:xanthine dehydrogenase family protein molybdopterin-binding subunit [Cytophagales bacterium]HNT49037.1 molybdopterin-dependent oxidoreductase [Cyclobacteriaceae bacterium]